MAFANGLCSGVLMHLPREHLPPAVLTLARILKPGGRLVISYRESRSGSERERPINSHCRKYDFGCGSSPKKVHLHSWSVLTLGRIIHLAEGGQ